MLRKVVSVVLLLCCALLALSIGLEVEAKRVKVRGYYRKDGTYVKPHTRKAPSRTKSRSSTSGNRVNPNKTWVRGYYRKDGTWVKGHYRTMPNDTIKDNYSYPGNRNPHTGKIAPGIPQSSNPKSGWDLYKSNKEKFDKLAYNSWVQSFPNRKWPKNKKELSLARTELNKEIADFNKTYRNYSIYNIKVWKRSQAFKRIKKWSNEFFIRTDDKFLNELDLFILKKRNFIVKFRFYERYIKVPRTILLVDRGSEFRNKNLLPPLFIPIGSELIQKMKSSPKLCFELELKTPSAMESLIEVTKATIEPLPLLILDR